MIRSPHMDFITGYARTKKRTASGLDRDLVNIQFRLHRQEIEAGLNTTFFRAIGIRNLLSQHLIPAADAQDPTASLQNINKQFLETTVDQPSQIGDCVLRAGNNDEVDRPTCIRLTQILQRHARNAFQRIEVRVIRNVRQPDHADSKRSCTAFMILERNTVLLINAQGLDVWKHSKAGPARAFFEKLRTAGKQSHVASKTVDDETTNQIPFFVLEKSQRPDNRCKDTTPIDIGDKYCW